jgi:glycosyltransferase involved in cell wall biosynthesis
MSNPIISVVVPVFNTARYLGECLDSLTGQTMREMEFVCVNDASTDNSPGILRKYAAKDSRIKIIDMPQNKGEAAARNTGLSTCTGSYIGFLDSDDYLDLDFYERLYTRIIKGGTDIVSAQFCFISDDKTSRKDSRYPWFCSSLWRKDFIVNNALSFPLGKIRAADGVFMCRALMCLPKMDKVSGVFYYYRQNPKSVSRNNSVTKEMSVLESYELVFNELRVKMENGILNNEQTVGLFGCFFNMFFCQISTRHSLTLSSAAEKAIGFYQSFAFIPGIDAVVKTISTGLYRLLKEQDKESLACFLGKNLKQQVASVLREKLCGAQVNLSFYGE